MNRFAFTLSVPPAATGAVAGILAYHLPGVTWARGDRVVHVVDTDDDLDAVAARLSHRPHRARISRVLAGYWQPPPSADGDPFVAATVMQTHTHHGHADRGRLTPVTWSAHVLPMRDPGPSDGGADRALVSRTVFSHRDVVVCVHETACHGPDVPTEPPTHHAMTLLSATHHWAGEDPTGGRAHAGTHR
jgi:hypothetical protein